MSFDFQAIGRACAGLLAAAAAAVVAMCAMAATCSAASVTTDVGVVSLLR